MDMLFGDAWYLGYAVSTDGAQTFPAPGKLESPNGQRAADPSMVLGPTGAFHLAWLTLNPGTQNDRHVVVASAPPGETSFAAPVEVTDPAESGVDYDKPWITVTGHGRLLVGYTRESTGGIAVATSADGVAWTRFTVVPDGASTELAYPCAAAGTGRVYVVFLDLAAGVRVRWSDDDGLTWPAESTLDVPVPGEPTGFAPPACVASGQELTILYGISSAGSSVEDNPLLSGLRLAHSSDGGKTIDRRAWGQDPSAGKAFLLPALARGENGSFDLAYFAGSGDGDTQASFRRAHAAAGGELFGRSLDVRAPVTLLGSRTSAAWPGDYVGLVRQGEELFAAYADNHDGESHIVVHAETLVE